MPPKQPLTLAAVESLIQEQTKSLTAEIASLRTEVETLRASLAAVQNLSNQQTTPTDPSPNKLFADVVKASVQSVLQNEDAKKEVVLNLPENNRDSEDMEELCAKTEIATKPSSITRIGKVNSTTDNASSSATSNRPSRPRPLKATFATSFDARTFMAKFEAYKKGARNGDSLKKVRCRPCRTREEQARHAEHYKEVHEMNEAAKSAGLESYSLRNNGEVWKFAKKENGKWKGVSDWTFTPSKPTQPSPPSGNGGR
jgi:anthranilate/para-aminobenzoate synthase component I